MIPRLARLCAVVLAFAAIVHALSAQAPTPAAQSLPNVAPAAPEEDSVNLQLPDADIETMLSTLEKLTGRTILRPAALPVVTYSLKFAKPMTKADAILAIETVLALNNIGIAPLGDKFLKVVDLPRVRQEAPEMIAGSTLDLPPSGKVATKLFQFEFARVQEIAPFFAGLLNPAYGGAITLVTANAALVTDSISNLQRVEQLVRQLDRPVTSGLKPKFFPVKNGTKASDLVQKLRTILAGMQPQLGSATTYSADDRTNQIVVVCDPRQWDFFGELIEQLDQKADPNTRTDVIYLKHAKAKDVVDVASKIISGQTQALQRLNAGATNRPLPQGPAPAPVPAQPATPAIISATAGVSDTAASSEFSPLMTVVNDERTNSVVVFGTADDIRLIRALIEKLDIVLAQVHIEVVIADVTLDDNHESGISALGLKVEGDKLVAFSGSDPSVTVSGGTITRPGLDLAAEIAIRTTPRKRNNSIITHQNTVTSHGKEAKFFSGETRPVVTGTINSAVGATTGLASSSTVTPQQIGTTLTVTPFIGSNGSVQFDLTQSVDEVTGEVKVDANTQYIIGKRESKSYVSAMSGDILVFGGFRKTSNINETSRLGPIPIIGDLLGSRKKSQKRSELVFFIRPTVLVNDPAIDNADTMKRVEALPARDAIKGALDPNFTPPKPSLIEKILP